MKLLSAVMLMLLALPGRSLVGSVDFQQSTEKEYRAQSKIDIAIEEDLKGRLEREEKEARLYIEQFSSGKQLFEEQTKMRRIMARQYEKYLGCLEARRLKLKHQVLHRATTGLLGQHRLELNCPDFCMDPISGEPVRWAHSPTEDFFKSEPRNLETTSSRLVTPRGSLMLLDLQVEDAGVYYCLEGAERTVLAVWVVHVDTPSDLQLVDVGEPLEEAKLSVSYEELGIEVAFNFGEYSECSRCHNVGIYSRYGSCMIRSTWTWEDHPDVSDDYRMLYVFGETGVPCASKYMAGIIKKTPIPWTFRSILQKKFCREACEPYKYVFTINPDETYQIHNRYRLLRMHFHLSQVPTKTYETFWRMGDRLVLTCPETRRKTQVVWTKGSLPMESVVAQNFGKDRVKITPSGQVIIESMTLEDFDTYVCYKKDGTLQGILKVKLYDEVVLSRLDFISVSVFLVVIVVLLVFIIKTGFLRSEPQADDLEESYTT